MWCAWIYWIYCSCMKIQMDELLNVLQEKGLSSMPCSVCTTIIFTGQNLGDCFLQEVGQRTQCVFKPPQREYPKKLRALWRPLWANWVDFMFCQNNVYAGFCFNIKKTEPAISSPKLLVILEISAYGADNNTQPWRPTRCDKSNTCTYNNLLDIDDISIPTSIALQVTVCK